MKKILVLSLLLFMVITPVFAENWVKLKGNFYADTDSIEEYIGDEGAKIPNNYSIWIKMLNNNSDYYKRSEEVYKTKIGYIKMKAVIDIKQKTFAKRNFVMFDTNDKIINSTEKPDKLFKWYDIPKNSNRERILKIINKELFVRNIKQYVFSEQKEQQ